MINKARSLDQNIESSERVVDLEKLVADKDRELDRLRQRLAEAEAEVH